MKKLLIIFALIVTGIVNSVAQPNPGFENWSTTYNYQAPDGWQTLNFLSIFIPANPLSAFKATGLDKHSGNYALKIKTIFVNNNPAPNVINDTVGLVFTGKITLSPPAYKYGFPYTGRPEKLEFWSKYIPVGNDSCGAQVVLLKRNGANRDTIAYGELAIGATASYTFFQFNLDYHSTELPDSAAIVFGSSKKASKARVGSTMYIDDVAFTGWVGIDEHSVFSDRVKTFPNPATDVVNFLAQIEEANYVKISDALGKETGIYKIKDYKANVNTSLFVDGIYFYQICDKKDNILTQGKFNVVK